MTKLLQAGVLAWAVPGGGHWFLGQRGLAIVLFSAITFVYAMGVAVGGVLTSVNPRYNKWLFLSEMGVGGYTSACYVAARTVESRLSGLPESEKTRYISYYPESDVAMIYLSTAGLLNVLAILDALSRAHFRLPTFHRHLVSETDAGGTGK